jgi:hypothetical protein
MDKRNPEFDITSGNPSARPNESYRVQLWPKVKDFLLHELYSEFVPRWFKEKQATGGSVRGVPEWILPSLKIGVGTGLCALPAAFDLGGYEAATGAVGLYIAADAVYQFIDMMGPRSEGRGGKAATLLVDIVSYPVYLISSKAQRRSFSRYAKPWNRPKS